MSGASLDGYGGTTQKLIHNFDPHKIFARFSALLSGTMSSHSVIPKRWTRIPSLLKEAPDIFLNLLNLKKPRPLGGVSVRWLCLEYSPSATPILELSPQFKVKGVADERVSKVISRDMAVSISHSMGTEISVPSPERTGCGRSVQLYPSVRWAIRVRSH